MDLSEDVVADIKARLHRVEGQIRGIGRMIDEGRECRDVVTQFAAASKALERAGYKFFSTTFQECLANPARAEVEGYSPEEMERLFLKLG